MSKLLILTADPAESLEVMSPCQRLLAEGHELHTAGPDRTAPAGGA